MARKRAKRVTQKSGKRPTRPRKRKGGATRGRDKRVQTNAAIAPRTGSHPTHPPCPGAAMPEVLARRPKLQSHKLYKRLDAGPVRKSDPWAYCRNQACPLYGVNQSMQPATSEVTL